MISRDNLRPFLLLLSTLFVLPAAFAQSADVTVFKSGPAEAAANSDVSYSITVLNLGPDGAPAVTLVDPLPAGMTFVSATQHNGPVATCTTPGVGANGSITCTFALFPAGASADFTFVAHIPAGTAAGTVFTNIATVMEANDPTTENDASTAVTIVPGTPTADLSVSKTGPSSAGPDSDVVYTIQLTNTGPGPSLVVELEDTLPGTMTFVSLVQNSGPTLSCVTPPAGSGGTITCTTATFAAGATAAFTLTTHVPADASTGTVFANTATASGTNDPDEENNVGTTTLSISTVDVSLTKSGPATATAGNTVSYVILVTNGGPGVAENVSFEDVLPPETTFVSLTQTSGSPAPCATPAPGSGGTVTCGLGTLNAAASSQFTLVVTAGNTLSIANTASADTDSFDTDSSNDTDSVTTTVTPSADLSVTKSGPATVTAGANVTYGITVTNNGPSDATSVSLEDTLPAGTTFVSLAQNSGPTFSCSTPGVGAGGDIDCTIATLTPGTTATFTFVFRVASGAIGSVANTAGIDSTVGDPASGNDSSTTTAGVTASADVSVTKTGPATVTAGNDVSYTVTVVNAGPSDAANVTLTDVLPPGTTFVSATQTAGPSFSCTTSPAGSPDTITCTIAALTAGTTASFTFVANVPADATGTAGNTASVTTTTLDPNAPNNSSTTTAVLNPGPTDLSITKTANGDRFEPGAPVTYTITVRNNGPGYAANVVVNDVLPAGTTFVSATPSEGSCTGTTTVVCTFPTLAPLATATIALVVTLPPTAGPVMNTATVSATNAETNPPNNASTSTIQIAATSDIPTVSPLGMLILSLALAATGWFVQRR